MNGQDILAKIQEMISLQFAVDAESITMNTSLEDDLGADSVDLMELVIAIEEEYEITVEESDVADLKTVGDCVNYLSEKVK